MSGEIELRAALVGQLRGDAALNALVNRVHDGEPAKASPPTVVVGEALGKWTAVLDFRLRALRRG